MQYMDKINSLKSRKILLPSLDPRARETSFKEFPIIRQAYSEILGSHHIDHFSINMVLSNGKMLVFSICPEIAYTLYSSRRGIEQDLAISPTFYDNMDFYFWEDCYSDESKREVMNKKEERFGIKAGAVIIKQIEDIKYLLSFGTKSSADNFKHDIYTNQALYNKLGSGCLEIMDSSIKKYTDSAEIHNAKIYQFKK